jgi:PAS domain S-box-containing protein
VRAQTGADAVGLRLQDGEDFPYFSEEGFSEDFLLTENTLAERGPDGGVCRDKDGKVCLECTCGLVIAGKTDPSNPLFTRGGSCWTNDSAPLLDLPPEQDPRHHPRNECIHQGYASVALIPIRDKERIVGLLHLNGRRKGLFSLATIKILEDLAAHIGEALTRKRVEDTREASEREFRSLAESMPQIVWSTRPDGWNIYFSQQWVAYTGLTLEESYGHGWITPFHPDDRQRALDAWKNATENAATYSLECRLRRADGVYRWWLVRGVPLRDENGKILKWFGTCTNIEDLKLAEESLRNSEERFRRAVVDSPFPILLHAEDGTIIQASNSWCEITGYTREELATIRDWTERAYGERKAVVQTDIDALYSMNHRKYEGDYTIRTKSGGSRVWEFSSAPLVPLPDGRRVVISMAMDVTERRQGEVRIANQLEELLRWQKVMLGREDRVRELKREVNGFCRRTGEAVRYPSQEDAAANPLNAHEEEHKR